jgi:hypothetical protein
MLYRSITGDYWITKVREEDIFTYRGVEDNTFDFSTVAKGFTKIRSDHNKDIVDNLRKSLVAEEGPGFPFFDLFLDAQNAFEQANYDLAIIYSVTALESIVKTYLVLYYRNESKETSDKVLRMPLNNLVTVFLPLIFRDENYNKFLKGITDAIGLRNKIIHESELGVSKNKSPEIMKDVAECMEFIRRKFKDLEDSS